MDTFTALLRRALWRKALFAALALLWLTPHAVAAGGTIKMDVLPEPPSAAQAMVTNHGCWVGEPPADMKGKLPGHVVVEQNGHAIYGGQHLVDQALQQVFNGKDHGLTVVGFCR